MWTKINEIDAKQLAIFLLMHSKQKIQMISWQGNDNIIHLRSFNTFTADPNLINDNTKFTIWEKQ